MHIKIIASAVAIALGASLASASAADRQVRDAEGIEHFTILGATPAEILTTTDADRIRGRKIVTSEGVMGNDRRTIALDGQNNVSGNPGPYSVVGKFGFHCFVMGGCPQN